MPASSCAIAGVAPRARYLAEGCIWIFRVDRTWSRDAAVNGNIAQFINHSCTPNCWFEVVDKTIWIRASRAIRAGEELTYDYRTEGDHTIPVLPARLQDLALIVATLRGEGRVFSRFSRRGDGRQVVSSALNECPSLLSNNFFLSTTQKPPLRF